MFIGIRICYHRSAFSELRSQLARRKRRRWWFSTDVDFARSMTKIHGVCRLPTRESERIGSAHRVIFCVAKGIHPPIEPDRIALHITPSARIVVAESVVVEPRFSVE